MIIELLKSHTHAGKRRHAGDRLELPETSARWLIEQGSAKPVGGGAETKSARRELTAPAATAGANASTTFDISTTPPKGN